MTKFSTGLLALLLVGAAGCHFGKAPGIERDYDVTRLTKRAFVIQGPNEIPNQRNQGFINNPGFVVTSRGVVVIDPGASVQVGEMVLAKIANITHAPVIAVFNTHVHGDHWLGNHAIKERFPKAVIYAHANMRAQAPGAGESWIALLNELTDGGIRGTRVVPPDVTLDDGEVLKLGDVRFRIYHHAKAHTDGDLMIEVVEEQVMFLGDNVIAGRVARMDDGDFQGNVAAIDIALASPARHFVPGHGPADGREQLLSYRRYLRTLYATVQRYYEQGLSDFEMKLRVAEALAAYQGWTDFDAQLGRHVSLAYLQVEAASF
jgi:glyoxylase-like metal-dependent hydrolase (beta-lactamase superfamily II)